MTKRLETHFWKAVRPPTSAVASLSALTHSVLIVAWVYATLPSLESPEDSPNAFVRYLPPPDPKPARRMSIETLRFVELAPEGAGAGFGAPSVTATRPPAESQGVDKGDAGRDSITAVAEQGTEGTDSVFTILEVDTAAKRMPGSAAPRYPPQLLEQRVEGQAIVRFVVDTTGLADTASFEIVLASHPQFVKSIHEALPGMRFSTARIGALKVRQLVELPFNFRIVEELLETKTAKRRSP